MARLVVFLIICVWGLGACVPAKKLVYLQEGDELKKRKEIPTDTILRTHQLSIKEYKIQPLDLLNITFETLSEETNSFDFLSKLTARSGGGGGSNSMLLNGILVDTEGNIEYAVLGKIKVVGLSLFEAQDSIKAVASRYLPDVVVRVKMLNFRFTVLGEVVGEQTVVSNNTRITMMEAVGLAGGFGELADRSIVKVIRQNGTSTDVYYINLLEEKFVESPKFYVQQNDVIIVPPLKQRTFKKYWVSNLGIITATLSFAAIIISLVQ